MAKSQDGSQDSSQASSGAAALTATQARPVRVGDRLVGLDLIRGIAVLGILLANVTGFGHPELAYYWPNALPDGGNEADRLGWIVQFVLVDGKFRGLFTILFGAGMVLFMDRAESRSSNPTKAITLQLRRLGWLLLFGMAHFFLLYQGDILFSYAIAGFFAMWAIRLSAERLLAIGIVWLTAAGALSVLAYLSPALIEAGNLASVASGSAVGEAMQYYNGFWDGQLLKADLQQQLVSGGGYWDIVRYRYLAEAGQLGGYVTVAFFETIPLMLVGMGFYRAGIFAGSSETPPWRGLAIGALLVGLAMNLALAIYVYVQGFPPFLTQLAFMGGSSIANIPLLLGGAALMANWAARAHDGWLADRLKLAGRMAFTNYIGTSLVMVLIFQGWAGGLYGQLHRSEMLLVVLLGWALMLQFSRLWLARFRYGPLEWIWRCLSYGKLFPMRKLPKQQAE